MNVSDLKAYTIPGVDSMPDDISSPLHLAPVEDKAVRVDFDGGRLSSDGGLILLGDPDNQLGLTRDLAAVLRDPRDPRRIDFTLHDLLKQRVLQITAGYADANDANTLRHDPIFKLLLGRLPESGPPLASQPTISRFENRVSRTELYRLARVFVDQFIASYDRPPKLIVLDFDDTEDPAHGEQEHIRYDGYYGGYCFLPLHVYEGLSGPSSPRSSRLRTVREIAVAFLSEWTSPHQAISGSGSCIATVNSRTVLSALAQRRCWRC